MSGVIECDVTLGEAVGGSRYRGGLLGTVPPEPESLLSFLLRLSIANSLSVGNNNQVSDWSKSIVGLNGC